MIFVTMSNKVLGKLYDLSKKGSSIAASKLHCPRSSPLASTLMAAVVPARIILSKRDDESEYGSVVTNISTINEVRTRPPSARPPAARVPARCRLPALGVVLTLALFASGLRIMQRDGRYSKVQ
jgi:hypothetical protein